MPHDRPESGCYDLSFQGGYPLSEGAEVALEDYAHVVARARGAEAIRASDDPSMVKGVHVCGLGTALSQALVTDIEDFARDLIVPAAGGGLGWS